ncbi:hypothetical protein ACP70R_039542 [Stipagrostis hirtigluma subsp. patula]
MMQEMEGDLVKAEVETPVRRPEMAAADVFPSTKRRKAVVVSSGAAAMPAAVLPDENMTEVLLRLPVKSILRFRAACGASAAPLSSDQFCSLHMAATEATPSSTPPKLLFVSPAGGFRSTAVYSFSPALDGGRGVDDELLFALDHARGNFVDVAPAPCRGLTLLCRGHLRHRERTR